MCMQFTYIKETRHLLFIKAQNSHMIISLRHRSISVACGKIEIAVNPMLYMIPLILDFLLDLEAPTL